MPKVVTAESIADSAEVSSPANAFEPRDKGSPHRALTLAIAEEKAELVVRIGAQRRL